MGSKGLVEKQTGVSVRSRQAVEKRETPRNGLFRQSSRRLRHPAFRRYYGILSAAVFLALVLRILHASALTYSPFSDMAEYLRYMRVLFQGGPYDPRSTVLFPPGYPFFLNLVSRIGGIATVKPILVAQGILDAAAVFAVASLARFCYGPRVAVLSAFGYALYRLAILFTGVVLPEAVCIDVMLFTLAAFAWELRRPGVGKAALTAILFAASVHLRANMATLIGVLAVYLLFYRWRTGQFQPVMRRRTLLEFFTLVVVATGLLVPWSVRNSKIAGRFSFVSDNVGHNLVLAHNYVSDGSYTPPELMPAREADKLKDLSGPEWHNAMKSYAIDFVKKHPAEFLFYLVPNKLEYLFSRNQFFWPWEMDDRGGQYADFLFGPFVRIPVIPYYPVVILGALGLFIRGRRVPYFVPVVWLSFIVPLLALLPSARYRAGSDVFLVLLAAAVISRLISKAEWNRILKIAGVGFVVWTLAATGMSLARLAGPDLLESRRILQTSIAGRSMIRGEYHELIKSASNEKPYRMFVCDVRVDPASESHLLLRTRFRVRPLEDTRLNQSLNVDVTYFDETTAPVAMPKAPNQLFSERFPVAGYLNAPSTAWRILNIPPLTRFVRLTFRVEFPAEVDIDDFELRGPIWSSAGQNSSSLSGAHVSLESSATRPEIDRPRPVKWEHPVA